MIASLGMYDRAETAAANDRLWALVREGLRARGIAAPEELTRGPGAYWPAWEAQDLVLSQTCGLPYRARLHGRVALVATPDHGLPGCPPGHYRSVFVARKGDTRGDVARFDGAALAYNDPMSQSGWAAPQAHAAQLGISLLPALESGGHRASALAVAEGRAEIAALDAVTWALIRRHDAFAASLKEVGQTRPTPALPYIAALGAPIDATHAALREGVLALGPVDRETLLLRDVVRIAAEDYLALPLPPEPWQIARPG